MPDTSINDFPPPAPVPPDKSLPRSSTYLCFRAVLLLLADGVATMFILPTIQKPLSDLGASWPLVTRLMYALHPVVVGCLPLLLAVAVVAKEFLIADVRLRRRLNLLALIFAGLWVGALIAAVFLPLIHLISSMSGQQGGTMPS